MLDGKQKIPADIFMIDQEKYVCLLLHASGVRRIIKNGRNKVECVLLSDNSRVLWPNSVSCTETLTIIHIHIIIEYVEG